MRRGYIYTSLIILILTLLWINSLFNSTIIVNPPIGSKPLFLGYRSNTIRIKSMNLTQLSQTAHKSGYNITMGQRIGPDEWVEGNVPTPLCRLDLSYGSSSNSSYFSFYYPEKSNATDWLWLVLGESLSLDASELETVKRDAYSNYQVDASGPHLGAYVDFVKPDWAIVAKYLGNETGRENDVVGKLTINFDSGAFMVLNSDALLIESRSVELGVVYVVSIDGDSDMCLYVDSSEKLENPIKPFTSMFEMLGIPKPELAKLSLDESWAYPV
jgi:hypothetical protein